MVYHTRVVNNATPNGAPAMKTLASYMAVNTAAGLVGMAAFGVMVAVGSSPATAGAIGALAGFAVLGADCLRIAVATLGQE